MVESINRNWVGGLSSGMDTQSLIDRMLQIERFPVNRLEQKRNTMNYQKEMLQEVNLRLFELQNKSADLIFSRTFNSKKLSFTNERALGGVATTAAAIGSYNIKIKQIATSTTTSSSKRLAAVLELGHNAQSESSIGGQSTKLGRLGVDTAQGIEISVQGGQPKTLNLGLDVNSSVALMISTINMRLDQDPELKNTLRATWDDKTGRVKLNLLDSTKTVSVSDGAGGNIIGKMFDAAGQVTINRNFPVRESELATIRSGLNATMGDLGITPFRFSIQRSGEGIEEFDISTLPASTSIGNLITELNSQINSKPSLNSGGKRLLEFRYDSSTNRLLLANTDTSDNKGFTMVDTIGGNFVEVVFGNAGTVSSTFDRGKKIVEETFANAISSGTFSIDGVRISIDVNNDTLQNVLSRITSSTGLNATYNSADDTISLTRKNGSSDPIGIGAAGDTSNFLSAVGLVAGRQSGDTLKSGGSISGIRSSATIDKAGFATPVNSGFFTINGVRFNLSSTTSTTLDGLLSTINSNPNAGVRAEYDSTAGRVVLTSTQTGNTTISLGAASDTSNILSALGLIGATQNIGQNAVFSIAGYNGGADLVRQTNRVSDVIEGLTLNLRDVTTGAGETITVEADTEIARKGVDDFIKSYNTAIELIFGRLTEKRNWELQALTDKEMSSLPKDELAAYEGIFKTGLLNGNSVLSSARGSMRNIVSAMVPGLESAFNSLAAIGISTGQVGSDYKETRTGLLRVVDEEKLMKALRENPQKASDLFGRDSTTENRKGIARQLRDMLNGYTRSDGILTRKVGRSGVQASNSQLDLQMKVINDQIARHEVRMKSREESLIRQFANLETLLSQYQTQSQAFSQQLAQLAG